MTPARVRVALRRTTRAAVTAGLLALPAGCASPATTLELRAHGPGGEPFRVPPGESARCFVVSDRDDGPVVVVTPDVDRSLVHHVALHRASRAPTEGDCVSMGSTTLLYMGSPGDDPLVAPAGTGLVLTESDTELLVLEIHYVNASEEPRADRSGLVLTAASSGGGRELGTWIVGDPVLEIPARAFGHVEERPCTIRTSSPVTLHAVSPHMHARGVAVSVTLERAGSVRTIVEVSPFDPARQRTVSLPSGVTLEPGDRVTTRCVYDNPEDRVVRYGTSVEDEMCFAYFWASPIGALRADADFCH